MKPFPRAKRRLAQLLTLVRDLDSMAGPHRRLLWGASAMAIVVAVVDAVFTIGVANVAITMLPSENDRPALFEWLRSLMSFGDEQNGSHEMRSLIAATAFVGVAAVLREMFQGILNTLRSLAGARIATHVRMRILERIMNARFSYLDSLKSGTVRQVMSGEAKQALPTVQSLIDLIGGVYQERGEPEVETLGRGAA